MTREKGIRNDGEAWSKITFLDEPCCECCGFPFEYDTGFESLCGDCSAHLPAYARARAAFVYDEASRHMVLSFKHGGRTEGLGIFAAHMRRAGRQFWDGADMLIPVPLHPSRLIKRRFNQSGLLARKLSRLVPARFEPDILFRIRATESQGAQSAKGRVRNVRGAFQVPDKQKPALEGKHVVLIDDVMTTGATLNACARTLKKAGASYIDVVTLARTVRQKTHSQVSGEQNA
ncbi:MAG: ComF family protein [Alphaproteobacteria bacterium]